MRKINSKFITKFISESGGFLQNKDYFAFVELDKYAIYVVADGIDSDIELSSAKIAVTTIISNFEEKPGLRKSMIKKLLKNANNELISQTKNQRLKASISIVVTDYVKIRYAVVGNTRFHLFRDGFIKTQSKDQSLSQELVEQERIELDKLAIHEEKNNLYCFLGQDEALTPFISGKIRLKDGDTITLQTRGIWQNVDGFEVLDVVEEAKEAQEVVDNVEDMILSRQPQKLENYTLAVIFIDKTYQNPKRRQKIKKIILTLIPIIIILAVISTMIYFKHKRKLEDIGSMNYSITNAKEYIEDQNFIRANEEYKIALELAKKLKMEEKREDIDRYYKLTETIISADESLYAGKYEESMDQYMVARERSYYSDNLAKDYIEEKMESARQHIQAMDLIEQGDKNIELGDIATARQNYIDAKNLASSIFLKDVKKEAEEKLNQINADISEQEKEEEEIQKAIEEEEEKIAKETLDTQLNAVEITKKGNLSYSIDNYYDAQMYYTMARDMYQNISMYALVDEMEKKIQLTDQKIKEVETKKSKAQMYVEDANKKFEDKKLSEAKMLYLFAKEIYQKSNLEDEVKLVDEKIKLIDSLIQNHSEGS